MSETSPETDAFLALAESLDDLVFVWKTTGEMLFTNRVFVRETGLTVDDFRFRNQDNPFIHPADLERVLSELGAFVDSDDRVSAPIANRFIDAWGRVHSIVSIVHKVDWHGELALMLWSRSDIASAHASTNEAHFRHLVEQADDGILKLSESGRIVYSNRRFQDMLGERAVAIALLDLPEVFHPDDRGLAARALEKLLAGSPRERFEARLVDRPDHETVWLSVNASPLEGGLDADITFSFVAIARDVSPTRRLEQKMRQAQRLESLGTLAGGIAHDFNNIVTGVLANATLAESMLDDKSQLAEMLQDIRIASERAAALNGSLLAYIGQAPQAAEPVDLTEIASDAVRMLAPLVPKSVKLELRKPEHALPVFADPGQISQIAVNLITNGAQAVGDRGGNVDVEVALAERTQARAPSDGARFFPNEPPPGRYVVLAVTDDGVGMDQHVLERIFEPFFTTKGLGRGLGLSATLGIVRQHHGAIAITSRPRQGSRFEVFLPLFEGKAATTAPNVLSRPPTADGKTVLFVDDEDMVRKVGQRILERAGYSVELASNGQEALEKLAADPDRISVLVVDHSMPGLRGDEVARSARSLRPGLPLVKTSGYRDVSDPAIDQYHTVVLAKPFTRADLLDAIGRAMKGA